jgi:lipopolysaccharide/colanic/teichoic acid biosynthesis glycosyltransferase
MDVAAALVLIVVLSPVILIGVLLVKLTSRGPALYRQVRLGKDGVPFTLLKLRTMKHNAEAETGPVWSSGHDGRITTLGKLLRQTHIDEFPQLWNVLRGEMSLIGPRPERPEFVAKLEWEVPCYRQRLLVRPGITGLAQLRLPPDTSLESVKLKVVHDVYYIRHANPALDAKLLAMTGWRLLSEVYGFGWKLVSLPTSDEVHRGFRRTLGIVHEGAPITLKSISAQAETKVDIPEIGTSGS